MICSARAPVLGHRFAITLAPPGPAPASRNTFESARLFRSSMCSGVARVCENRDQARTAGCSARSIFAVVSQTMESKGITLELEIQRNLQAPGGAGGNRTPKERRAQIPHRVSEIDVIQNIERI